MDHEWRNDPKKRAKANRHLKVVQAEVAASDKTVEDLQAEMANVQVLEGGVPVAWGGGVRGNRVQSQARIASPDSRQTQAYTRTGPTCLDCRFFDLKQGRSEIIKQRFAERLVLEQEWALRHIGPGLDHLALCGQSNGELAVTSMSPACESFRERKGKLDT